MLIRFSCRLRYTRFHEFRIISRHRLIQNHNGSAGGWIVDRGKKICWVPLMYRPIRSPCVATSSSLGTIASEVVI